MVRRQGGLEADPDFASRPITSVATKLTLALLLISSTARADTAQEHFARGQSLYDATRYEAALHEFEVAQSIRPAPALLYDMAKCLERLGRKEEAARAYARYVAEAPPGENVNEVLSAIGALRAPPPAVDLVASPPPPHPSRRRVVLPSVVGGATVAIVAVGAGLLGSARADYAKLDSSCSPHCSRESWAGIPPRERGGYALLGVAGAGAAVDIYLIVRAARNK
jgi:tetratricopeptide (TPR) repeat protein